MSEENNRWEEVKDSFADIVKFLLCFGFIAAVMGGIMFISWLLTLSP